MDGDWFRDLHGPEPGRPRHAGSDAVRATAAPRLAYRCRVLGQEPTWCLVYIAGLDQLSRDRHEPLLSGPERSRRGGLRLSADRDRFTLACVLVRSVVARHAGIATELVVVGRTCDQCGKQHGRAQVPGTGTEVSVSHAGNLVGRGPSQLPNISGVATIARTRLTLPMGRDPERDFMLRYAGGYIAEARGLQFNG
jgi:hypothetical protein